MTSYVHKPTSARAADYQSPCSSVNRRSRAGGGRNGPRSRPPGRAAVGRRGSNQDHQVAPMPTIWNRRSGHLAIGAGVREAVPWRSRAPLLPQPGGRLACIKRPASAERHEGRRSGSGPRPGLRIDASRALWLLSSVVANGHDLRATSRLASGAPAKGKAYTGL
jgi:hypothetical protein